MKEAGWMPTTTPGSPMVTPLVLASSPSLFTDLRHPTPGCMLHSYNLKEVSTCLASEASSSRRIVFAGDSTARVSFWSLAKLVDPYFSPTTKKHADQAVQGPDGLSVEFYWDPFLNTSATSALLAPGASAKEAQPPALLVFSTGLWHMRYLSKTDGPKVYASTLDRIFNAAATGGQEDSLSRGSASSKSILADEVVVFPLQLMVEHLLSSERAASMNNKAVGQFNDILRNKEASASHGRYAGAPTVVEVPWSFNEMLGPDGREAAESSVDGLHLSDTLARHQLNVLLNLRCNDVMPKKFPRA